MELMVFEAPSGELLFEPTQEQLAAIISQSGPSYWQQGGNGEAAIRVARRPGDDRPRSHAVLKPDGTQVEYLAGQPQLWIKRPEAGGFFFTWDNHEGWVVPYDGSGCEAFVMDERGGDPFKIPRACLVGTEKAVEIANEFLRSRERSPAVHWESWYQLPITEDW